MLGFVVSLHHLLEKPHLIPHNSSEKDEGGPEELSISTVDKAEEGNGSEESCGGEFFLVYFFLHIELFSEYGTGHPGFVVLRRWEENGIDDGVDHEAS